MKFFGMTDRAINIKFLKHNVFSMKCTTRYIKSKRPIPLFIIPKELIEPLIKTGLKVVQIVCIYRRMRHHLLSTVGLASKDDETPNVAVRRVVAQFPRCGEEMLNKDRFFVIMIKR